MDLSLKEYLMEDFEPMSEKEIFNYFNSLDRELIVIVATKLAIKEQRRERKSPYQIVGEIEEKKKELLKNVSVSK